MIYPPKLCEVVATSAEIGWYLCLKLRTQSGLTREVLPIR